MNDATTASTTNSRTKLMHPITMYFGSVTVSPVTHQITFNDVKISNKSALKDVKILKGHVLV